MTNPPAVGRATRSERGALIDRFKSLTIASLIVTLFWFGATIVRLENIRYANEVGMCDVERPSIEYFRCIDAVETRTHPLFHLYYALFD